jgi:hypothetical protein
MLGVPQESTEAHRNNTVGTGHWHNRPQSMQFDRTLRQNKNFRGLLFSSSIDMIFTPATTTNNQPATAPLALSSLSKAIKQVHLP